MNNLINLIKTGDDSNLSNLQKFAVYLNRGERSRTDKEVIKIAESIKNRINGKRLMLVFSSRIAFAYEQSHIVKNKETNTILYEDLLSGKTMTFEDFKDYE